MTLLSQTKGEAEFLRGEKRVIDKHIKRDLEKNCRVAARKRYKEFGEKTAEKSKTKN